MLSRNEISDAFLTFLDKYATQEEIDIVRNKCDTRKDLLLFILIETDFIKRFPTVFEALNSVSATVVRSGLDSYRPESKKYRMVYPLKERLYQKQLEWARESGKLTKLESEIADLRRKIASYET